jgi:hypothetical protein
VNYLTGKDYPELCEVCRGAISACAEVVAVGPDVTASGVRKDDEEAPLMYAGDHRMLCGGHICAEREARERKPEVWRVHASVEEGDEGRSVLSDEDFDTYPKAFDRARVLAGDKAGDIDGKAHSLGYDGFCVWSEADVDKAFYFEVAFIE